MVKILPSRISLCPTPPLNVRRRSISRDKDAGTNVTQTICPTKVVSKLVPPYNRVPGQTEQIFKLRSYHLKIVGGFFFFFFGLAEKRNAPEHQSSSLFWEERFEWPFSVM